MNMNKSVVYTRTGDKGTTSLVGGKRVPKIDKRIESYGTIDELNAFVGLLTTEINEQEDLDFLRFVQHKLFTVGSYLATDTDSMELRIESKVTPETILRIEREIDCLDSGLPRMKNFVLPGGCRSAALAHVCRTICRRSERQIYRLCETAEIEEPVLIFVNRLSDYFFVLARKECIRYHGKEIIWDYSCI
jgi:cob(I)alamin adenosyltransferase